MLPTLTSNSENDKERRIHVRADRNINYGKVMEVMGLINSAGFTKVALVSEAPGSASPRRVGPGCSQIAPPAEEN